MQANDEKKHPSSRFPEGLQEIFQVVRLFFAGSFTEQIYQHSRREALAQEDLFLLLILGDWLGIPTSGYLQLKLLPHLVEKLEQWGERVSRPESQFWKEMEKFAREF